MLSDSALQESKPITTRKQQITWADFHPEVAGNFARPFIPWPCEKIQTDLGYSHQPCIVKDAAGVLYVAGGGGKIWHSRDRGCSWARLCQSLSFVPPLPKGNKEIVLGSDGLGITAKGTLLVHWRRASSASGDVRIDEETFTNEIWVTRSHDGGRTWQVSTPFEQPEGEYLSVGKERIYQMPGGRLLLPASHTTQSRPGRLMTTAEEVIRGLMFASDDDGATWYYYGERGDHCDETDLLCLPSGRILAAIRYQRKKSALDPSELIDPATQSAELGGNSVYKHTCIAHSDDEGKTWSHPRLVTGFVQQTACLARLSDGTIIMPFGHKDGTLGQRFVVSYDDGETWSNAVFELNDFGVYASTVVLDDDTLVTAHETRRQSFPWVMLHVLRWKAPSRREVEKHGFFTPRLAH